MTSAEMEQNVLVSGANIILIQSCLDALTDTIFAHAAVTLGAGKAAKLREQFDSTIYDTAFRLLQQLPADSPVAKSLQTALFEVAPHQFAQQVMSGMLKDVRKPG